MRRAPTAGGPDRGAARHAASRRAFPQTAGRGTDAAAATAPRYAPPPLPSPGPARMQRRARPQRQKSDGAGRARSRPQPSLARPIPKQSTTPLTSSKCLNWGEQCSSAMPVSLLTLIMHLLAGMSSGGVGM